MLTVYEFLVKLNKFYPSQAVLLALYTIPRKRVRFPLRPVHENSPLPFPYNPNGFVANSQAE
jgi:hypothetical protein